MGKKSTKENKNVYQLAREAADMTREEAAEALEFVSESRIEKIEGEKSLPEPDEVLAMANAYKKPSLCELPIKLTLVLRIHSFSSFSSVV